MITYDRLKDRYARLSAIGDALGILGWDTQTMMPTGSADSRAEQVATLEVLQHELATDPAIADWLAAAEAAPPDDPWQAANVREMRHAYIHATAVPTDLVEANSRATSRCEMAWREARSQNNFAALVPSLTEVLRGQQLLAQAKADALGCTPYEALLDVYEPGAVKSEIDTLFADLADFLPGFLAAVLERQRTLSAIQTLTGPFPVEAQRRLGVILMTAAGFDFQRGRLDISLHPFCGGASDDIRITTRYDEDDFAKALMGVMHETGHALYELGLPAAGRHQPVGGPRGMGIHESQSLIIEMQACRSRAFLDYAVPLMVETFGGTGPAWSVDNIHRLYTRVEPGFIRVDADEVTYPAHIIVRYRLEQAMIAGDLALTDLPGAWNEAMAQLLGVTVPNDRLGCLQDIHWPGGGWGYFPTYTLGAMTAAQLFATARQADSDLIPGLARGDFGPLVRWLRHHVHGQGCLLSSRDLVTAATGQPLNSAFFKAHLTQRYLDRAG